MRRGAVRSHQELRGVSSYEGSVGELACHLLAARLHHDQDQSFYVEGRSVCVDLQYDSLQLGDQCKSWDKLVNETEAET